MSEALTLEFNLHKSWRGGQEVAWSCNLAKHDFVEENVMCSEEVAWSCNLAKHHGVRGGCMDMQPDNQSFAEVREVAWTCNLEF